MIGIRLPSEVHESNQYDLTGSGNTTPGLKPLLFVFCFVAFDSLGGMAQTDMQLFQLFFVDFTRSLSHETGRTLGFREDNHVTNGRRTGHQHHQTIQAKRQTTVWRTTELQCIQQEAELGARFFFTNAQDTEHRFLHGAVVNTDRTATQLGTVQHHVVSAGQCVCRVGCQLFGAARRCGERVVNRSQAAVRGFLEHREVDHPHGCPFAGQHLQVVTYTNPQCTQGFVNNGGFVGTEEHDVAVFSSDALDDRHGDVITQEFHDRRLKAFDALGQLIDLDVSQALGTVDADELGVIVDLLAAQLAAFRHAKGCNTALGIFGGASENLEVHAFYQIAYVLQLQRDAQIRLVTAITLHGFGIRHTREFRQLNIQNVFEQ